MSKSVTATRLLASVAVISGVVFHEIPRIACANDFVTVVGSWSGVPSQTETAVAFTKETGYPVHVVMQSSSRIFGWMADGRIDVGIWSPSMGTQLDEAIERTFADPESQPTTHAVGQFVVYAIVHPANPVRQLTYQQLHGILDGSLKNWSDVGGPRGDIVLIGEGTSSKSRQVIVNELLGPFDTFADMAEFKTIDEVAAAVAQERRALGFALYRREPVEGVKAVAIARDEKGPFVPPSDEAMLARRYPLAEDLYLVLRPNAQKQARDYVAFATGTEGAKVASKWFLFPEYEHQQWLAAERQKAIRAGQGSEVAIAGPAGDAKLANDLGRLYVEEQGLLQIKYAAQRQAADGVAALTAGEAELLFVDGDASEFAAQLREHNSQVLGRRAVGVIVHPSNDIPELLLSDLKDIYEGNVPNWPGETARLQMVGPESSGVVADVFRAAISAERRKVPYAAKASTEQIIRTVARDPAAIGIVDLSEFPAEEKSVRLVPILRDYDQPEAIAPRLPLPSDYPLARTYTLYISPTASEETQQFVKFLTAPRLAEVLAPHGLQPP